MLSFRSTNKARIEIATIHEDAIKQPCIFPGLPQAKQLLHDCLMQETGGGQSGSSSTGAMGQQGMSSGTGAMASSQGDEGSAFRFASGQTEGGSDQFESFALHRFTSLFQRVGWEYKKGCKLVRSYADQVISAWNSNDIRHCFAQPHRERIEQHVNSMRSGFAKE